MSVRRIADAVVTLGATLVCGAIKVFSASMDIVARLTETIQLKEARHANVEKRRAD